jgi:tetratricopeptide (TPR) repeat protein
MAAAHFFFDWNIREAERELRRALELDPGYPTAHVVYAAMLGSQGRFDEAIAQDRLAIEHDPLSLLANWDLVNELVLARRFDKALAQARRLSDLYPNSPLAQFSTAGVYEMQGDYAKAAAVFERAANAGGDGRQMAEMIRRAYDTGGREGYLRLQLDHAKSEPPNSGSFVRLAQLHALLGNRDQAFSWLDRAAEARSCDLLWLEVNPGFDSLRQDPRYVRLVRTLGFDKAS